MPTTQVSPRRARAAARDPVGRRVFSAAGAALLGIAAMMAAASAGVRIETRAATNLPAAGMALTILTWNLGYGGLGKESDFVADGGRRFFPPSRAAVRKNIAHQAAFLARADADIVLLQEAARAGPANLWHDVLAAADAALPAMHRSFYADVRTRLLPPPFRSVHGLSTISRVAVLDAQVVPLPLEPDSLALGIRRRYGLLVSHVPIDRCGRAWTIINLHLAAFDEGAHVRRAQAQAAIAFAQAEYARGKFVVLGGDWNFLLRETDFSHTTRDEFLSWIHPFPDDLTPQGWTLAADAATPSVRTNERPYRPGENYTGIIDGFLVSPNIKVAYVRGIDLSFEASDHQPVEIRVMAKGCHEDP